MNETRSTCPYCGVGCGVVIESEGSVITGVRGDPAHPANFGRLCSKGQTLHLTAAPHVQGQVRALHPMRRAARGAPLERVTWDSALDEVAGRLGTIVREHGPDAVGLYLSGQLLTEDYYVFNKLGKGLLGTNNVDTNSRLCMSSAVAGYKQSLGADSVPACYDDIALAQCVFITGSNMAWAHPVLYRRLEDARRANPTMKVIVVDPRRTETADEADLFLQIQPGTDVVLHHALLHVMLWENLTDAAFIAAHTTGFAALRDRVREFSPAHAAKVCGVKADDIVTAARWFAGVSPQGEGGEPGTARAPTLSLWCQGLNQSASGTDKNSTLINLHLATGQIGKPGAGPLSLTGQPNAMGGREVGGLANLLSAHRDMANAEHRAEVARLWGVDSVPATPGKTAIEMFRAAAEGDIKALWIVCTNPAQSLPDQALVRRALERCEFVVVQEAYRTAATVGYADVLLPAASWGEKEGTVTNSERRITRVRAAVPPPGEARADWRIAVDVARRLDTERGQRLFSYGCPEAIWNEHRESTRGRDLDITGLSYEALVEPRSWPWAEGARDATPRLYTDHRFATPEGRARFVAPAWRGVAEPRDARFPVALTTGRLRDQWHGLTRTGTLGRLHAHSPAPVVQMHPQELVRRHWKEGDLVRVASRRGALLLPVQGSDRVPPAQAFIAMHWGSEVLAGRGSQGVNALTPPAFCPQSKQPELKHTAVRIERAELPWSLVAAAWLPAGRALEVRGELLGLSPAFDFVSLVPFGHEAGGAGEPAEVGILLRAAAAVPIGETVRAALAGQFGLDVGSVLRYADARRGARRDLKLRADGTLQAYLVAGDCAAAAWLQDWLRERRPAAVHGRALLAAGEMPPQPTPPRGAVLCSCNDVGEAELRALLPDAVAESEGDDAACLAALQRRTRCGTTCGSCLPALKGWVRQHAARVAAAPAPAPA